MEQPRVSGRYVTNGGSHVPALALHIDIDGPAPLNVVSGTVAADGTPAPARVHFLGRVARNRLRSGRRHLLVEDFAFRWPDSTHVVDRAEIQVSRHAGDARSARVTFVAGASRHRFGPFPAARVSPFFREAEVEVDIEESAVPAEPYLSTLHPDRPADLAPAALTLESAFAEAGIRITRIDDPGRPVPSVESGRDRRWSEAELHDSMARHWQAYANRPQWKLWIFLANRGDDDGLGGVMFDGDIDEPGGVDRQGTAVFTRCPVFHTPEGEYCAANPPADIAMRRELFFNLVHETGHAFNLAHSFGKEGGAWQPPPWAPVAGGEQALSWMNYPDLAMPSPDRPMNASAFYRRFRFTFDPGELLFLRHAPEAVVEMGAGAWFEAHGRATRERADPRLAFAIRTRKEFFEFGEPVMLELKLKNVSDGAVRVHANLDPADSLIELAITDPSGRRSPFLPIARTRRRIDFRTLAPAEAVYRAADVTMGRLGFHFKTPGAYRIEGVYRAVDGRTASAVGRLVVRPPRALDDVPRIARLFDAAVGRVLYVEGTRVLEDVNRIFDEVAEAVGPRHPLGLHLRTVRYLPFARDWKVVEPESDNVRVIEAEPDVFAEQLAPVVLDAAEEAADTLGHIWFNEVVDTFTRAALACGTPRRAVRAQRQLIELFRSRDVKHDVIACAEDRLRDIE